MAKNREKTLTITLLKQQATQRLAQIERQLKAIERAIAERIEQDEDAVRRRDILLGIPGIATATAHAILIEMPELGTLGAKQVASLAGLAPVIRESGKWKGKARIGGGRASLRQALYPGSGPGQAMPALVATRFNPDLKARYDTLRKAGKPAKLAITAVMRKLLITANALIRDDRNWTENPA